ncbi:MAG: UDP-N-acetylglucosamine pyrophosphorylase [Lachnospiraceae bacterium]|nr:UDP-N-acetylglucosamine pyrophosphorylase [Lachnospiraceae bacterium]
MQFLRIEVLLDVSKTIATDLFTRATYPWEVLPFIGEFIKNLGKELPAEEYDSPSENVWIHKTAKVAPSASINGPCIICENAEIRQCAFIRGNAIVGRKSVLGNSCEMKNAILFDEVQVPHFNYVGDAILGYKSHMGAGSITSNVRQDKQNIVLHVNGEHIETGLRKFGAILGDHVEVGCNAVMNPGSVIGRDSNIYPLSMVRGFVPACSIYKNENEIVLKR